MVPVDPQRREVPRVGASWPLLMAGAPAKVLPPLTFSAPAPQSPLGDAKLPGHPAQTLANSREYASRGEPTKARPLGFLAWDYGWRRRRSSMTCAQNHVLSVNALSMVSTNAQNGRPVRFAWITMSPCSAHGEQAVETGRLGNHHDCRDMVALCGASQVRGASDCPILHRIVRAGRRE